MTTASSSDARPDIVPWVAMWSAEQEAMGGARISIAYRDDKPRLVADGGWLTRFGDVLWATPPDRRSGTPLFGQVHAGRQRRAMLHRICQVCGCQIGERPIPWITAKPESAAGLVNDAPVCAACAPTALALCPRLRGVPPGLWLVERYRLWGVSADIYDLERGGDPVERAFIIDGHPATPFIVAKQQIVRFTRYQAAELVDGQLAPAGDPITQEAAA